MATLLVKQFIFGDAYKFNFSLDKISESDRALVCKYGEPTVNLGGNFDDGMGLTYILPDSFVKLISGFPTTVTLDLTVSPFSSLGSSTAASLVLYRTTIEGNVTSAFGALRANSDTFSGEFITNI